VAKRAQEMETGCDVSSVNQLMGDGSTVLPGRQPGGQPSREKISAVEILLQCCALVSLLTSCALWSQHKQPWMDEIFTWREVSDPSLWHLYGAIQHGADGGMPLFYATAWLWAKTFGTSVLTLRFYSCVAMCAALLVTWKTLRRFYGMWATAFGILLFWGTSGLLLDQNAEARFYGLFLLVFSIAVDIYTRLVAQSTPKLRLLIFSLLTQAALVSSHVLGIIYGASLLLALILSDRTMHRLRPRVYLFHVAGWISLIPWTPAIRASMAAGKPHGWIVVPNVKFLISAYLFDDSLQWFNLLERHSSEVLFQVVRHGTELVMLLLLALVLVVGLRKLAALERQANPDPRAALLLAAYLTLSIPLLLFVLSHLITPVFVPRYLLPCGVALAVVMADFSDGMGADKQNSPRLARGVVALLLAALPVLSALVLPPLVRSWEFLDVQRLDQVTPPNMAVVAGWQGDFAKLMRLSHGPTDHYYFLLDWPSALAGSRSFVLDYHLMSAYRDVGYYPQNIRNSDAFLCSHTEFLVLDSHLLAKDDEGPSWFDLTVKDKPQFEWKVVNSFDGPEVKRNLISVHRTEPLPFCNRP
jgi:hypothetical protein